MFGRMGMSGRVAGLNCVGVNESCVSKYVECSVRIRNAMRMVGQNLKANCRQGNWKDSKLCCAHRKSAHAQSVGM